MSKLTLATAALAVFTPCLFWGQQQKPQGDMASMSASEMHDMPGMDNEGSAHAMHSMEGRHMDMGSHMRMTTLRDPKREIRKKPSR
jgi:hypothetical protein